MYVCMYVCMLGYQRVLKRIMYELNSNHKSAFGLTNDRCVKTER